VREINEKRKAHRGKMERRKKKERKYERNEIMAGMDHRSASEDEERKKTSF